MSRPRHALAHAVRTIRTVRTVRTAVEPLEPRRLLAAVQSIVYDPNAQQLRVTLTAPVAATAAPGVITYSILSHNDDVEDTQSRVSTDGPVATYAFDNPYDGWFEAYVRGPLLDADEYEHSFTILNGDFDNDGGVSINDFNVLGSNFGKTHHADGSPMKYTEGDCDYDGTVSINDFNLLAAAYGHTLPALPTRPGEIVVANLEDDVLEVAWAADDAPRDGFKVYRSDDGGHYFVAVATVADPGVRSWSDYGSADYPLVAGQKYWYRVRAYTDAAGASAAVTKASGVVTHATPPVYPLSAAGIGPGRVSLKWTPPADTGVVAYRVYRGTTPDFLPTPQRLVTTVDPTKTQVIDSGLSPGHRYYYRVVVAGDRGSVSIPSMAVTVLAQNEGRGIGNGVTPFNPATHDSDADGKSDALDDDNDNDGKPDEQDDDDNNNGVPDNAEPDDRDNDGDGDPDNTDPNDDTDTLPDDTDPDDDNDGTPDALDPSTGTYGTVPYGPGGWEIFSTNTHPSFGDSKNGYTPDYVDFTYSTPDVIEQSMYDEYHVFDRPKLYDFHNETQTLTFRNLPKHSIISVSGDIYGVGVTTDKSQHPERTGVFEMKADGNAVPIYNNGDEFDNGVDAGPSVRAFMSSFQSGGDSLTVTIKGSGFGPGGSWDIHILRVSVTMPEVSIAVDRDSLPEAGEAGYRLDENGEEVPFTDRDATFTVSRTGPAVGDLPVSLEWPESTADESDASGRLDSVTIPDGASSKTFTVAVADDNKIEWTELLAAKVKKTDNGKYVPSVSERTACLEIVSDDLTIGSLPDTIWTNNDDDNDNGIPDKNETGSVTGEDDLVPLTLNLPEETKQGATYTLSSSKARFWADGGRQTRLGSGNTVTWTYGQGDTPPQIIWVEMVSPSGSAGDAVIVAQLNDSASTYPSTRPTSAPTTKSTTTQATNLELTLSTGRNILVGENAQPSASVAGPDSQNATFQWTAPAAVFAGYETTATSHKAKMLQTNDLKQGSLTAYFYDGTFGGQESSFRVVVSLNGKSKDGNVKFKVYKPQVQILKDTQGKTGIAGLNLGNGPQPVFGLVPSATSGDGIQHQVQVNMPPGFNGGTYHYTQLIDYTFRYQRPWGRPNVLQTASNNGQKGLDGQDPYAVTGGPFPTGAPPVGQQNPVQGDHPAFTEPTTASPFLATYYEGNEQFLTFIMFTPAGGISVPLKKETWGWKGKFIYQQGNPPWTVDNNFSNQWTSGFQDTTDFPAWNNIISNNNFQWVDP